MSDGAIDVVAAKAAIAAAGERFSALSIRHDDLFDRLEQAISHKIALEFEANAVFQEMMRSFSSVVETARSAGIPLDLSQVRGE
jgi:hypothetical protein